MLSRDWFTHSFSFLYTLHRSRRRQRLARLKLEIIAMFTSVRYCLRLGKFVVPADIFDKTETVKEFRWKGWWSRIGETVFRYYLCLLAVLLQRIMNTTTYSYNFSTNYHPRIPIRVRIMNTWHEFLRDRCPFIQTSFCYAKSLFPHLVIELQSDFP